MAAGLLAALAVHADVAASPTPSSISSRAVSADSARGGAFRTIDMVWTDPSRQREIPVRLYWPDAASPTAAVPLVVFSHGLGGTRNG